MARKLKKAKDKEAKNHELHCWIHDTEVNQRTLYTCNCSERENYKSSFAKNRPS